MTTRMKSIQIKTEFKAFGYLGFYICAEVVPRVIGIQRYALLVNITSREYVPGLFTTTHNRKFILLYRVITAQHILPVVVGHGCYRIGIEKIVFIAVFSIRDHVQ